MDVVGTWVWGLAALTVPLARSGAAWASIGASTRVRQPAVRRSWRYFGTGLGLWAIAGVIRFATESLAVGAQAAPTAGEWLQLAAAIAVAVAAASYPVQPPDRFGRLRSLLDVAILVIAVLALSWLVLIRPVLQVGLSGPAPLFWAAVRLASDLIGVALLLRLLLLARRQDEIVCFRSLTLAAILQSGADLLIGYRQLLGASSTFLRGATLGELAAGLLLAYGASRIGRSEGAPGEIVDVRPFGPPLEALLPVAVTYLVVGFTGVDYWIQGNVDSAGLFAGVGLSLLLVARQGVIAGQVEMRQFAALVNASTDLSFIADAEGRVLLSNPALRNAVGDGSGSAVLRMGEFVEEDLLKGGEMTQAIRSGWSGEVHLRGEDGRPLPVSLSLQPVRDERRRLPLIAGTAYDLSDVKARQDKLESALEELARSRVELEGMNVALETKVGERTRQLAKTVADLERVNEELKELDRLKTEFLALISHELRSPLTNIHSGLELLLSRQEDISGKTRQSLGLIQAEAERLARFLEATLDLSSLQAGKLSLKSMALSLPDAAEEARRRFPDHAGGERLRLQIPDDLPFVQGDAGALGSIFYHLMDNGLKYSETGDVIVTAGAEPAFVRVSVLDSGLGIPESERERIFDMFHRLDASDSRRVYGHGLGLPLARQLVEAMGGRILAEAGEGGGTRMVFWLPRAEPLS